MQGLHSKSHRGSAIARLAGLNVEKHPELFDTSKIPFWVFEEQVSEVSLPLHAVVPFTLNNGWVRMVWVLRGRRGACY